MLGVRSSDAAAFCTWLTQWKAGPWLYRLPEAGELKDASLLSRIPAGTGYWLEDGQGFAWAKEAMMLPGNVVQELVDHLARFDLASAHARALDLVRARALALASARARALVLDSVIDLDSALVRDLDRASARSSARARDLALFLVLIYNQEKLFSRRGIRQVSRFGRARKSEKDVLQRAIDSLLDIAMDLVILEKRTRGELAPCEGVLIVRDRK